MEKVQVACPGEAHGGNMYERKKPSKTGSQRASPPSSPLIFQPSVAPLHPGSNLQHVPRNSIQTMAFKSGPSRVRLRVQNEQALGSLHLLKWLGLFP